jgi:hypothetical protein
VNTKPERLEQILNDQPDAVLEMSAAQSESLIVIINADR